jgi:hypothetical protein
MNLLMRDINLTSQSELCHFLVLSFPLDELADVHQKIIAVVLNHCTFLVFYPTVPITVRNAQWIYDKLIWRSYKFS